MEKITRKELEELVLKDETLTAKAKELTGEGEELNEKLKAFAASLGYELDLAEERQELAADEIENVVGGIQDSFPTVCPHKNMKFIRKQPGLLWGTNSLYRCTDCGRNLLFWD